MADISTIEGCMVELGEGPHWDEDSQKLVYVDIFGKSVHIYDPSTRKDQKYTFADTVGAAVPRQKGGSLAVLCGRNFVFLDLETGKQEIVATVDEDKPGNRFNDGKCDPAGRFWGGTMGPEPRATEVVPDQGSLYCLDIDGTVKAYNHKFTTSNGLGWSPDNKTMYFIDSIPARCVYAYDYDVSSGEITNRKIAVQAESNMVPDGMTVDAEGMLWVAFYNGAKVVRYDPTTGKALRTIDFPVTKTTSCSWLGPDYDDLIVTSERARLSPEEREAQPLAGSVFKVKNLGVKGLPSVPYKG